MNMEDPKDQEDWLVTEAEESEESSYSWWTVLVALLLALSLIGSFLWRAFPPAAILDRTGLGASPKSTPDLPISLSVHASAGWVDTGLDLTPGGYRITALGRVALDQATPESEYLGPEGGLSRCRATQDQQCAMGGAPYGALIGRIDDGEPFKVGAVLVLEVARPGRLKLAVNDRIGDYRDNEGSLTVRVDRFDGGGFESALNSPPALR